MRPIRTFGNQVIFQLALLSAAEMSEFVCRLVGCALVWAVHTGDMRAKRGCSRSRMPTSCNQRDSSRARRRGLVRTPPPPGTSLDERPTERARGRYVKMTCIDGVLNRERELTLYARLSVTVKRVLSSPPTSENAVTMSSSILASFVHPDFTAGRKCSGK